MKASPAEIGEIQEITQAFRNKAASMLAETKELHEYSGGLVMSRRLIFSVCLIAFSFILDVGCKGQQLPPTTTTYLFEGYGVVGTSSYCDDQVYIAGRDGYVYAFHRDNGALLWKTFVAWEGLQASIVFADDKQIIVGKIGTREDGWVAYLDPHTGKIARWEQCHCHVNAVKKVEEGRTLWFTGTSIWLSDDITNTKIWKRDFAKPMRDSGCVDGDIVFLGTNEGRLYSLDLKTGNDNWVFEPKESGLDPPDLPAEIPSRNAIFGKPAIHKNLVMLCAGTDASTVFGVDKATGTSKWKTPLHDRVFSSMYVIGDVAVFCTNAGKITAIECETGRIKWINTLKQHDAASTLEEGDHVGNANVDFSDDRLESETLALINGYLYIGSENGLFARIEPATGHIEWQIRLDSEITFPPGGHDGNIYVGSSGTLSTKDETFDKVGYFYRIDENNGNIRWKFKMGMLWRWHSYKQYREELKPGDIAAEIAANDIWIAMSDETRKNWMTLDEKQKKKALESAEEQANKLRQTREAAWDAGISEEVWRLISEEKRNKWKALSEDDKMQLISDAEKQLID